ncbi:hypothetical protein HF086_007969 [Spodoptera exigua]|uniref:unspecific monooxygenase n=1 Tax=Spodoptera exigua TaxID=7107 RepID=A0A922SPE2_SPOEX|nr:hypothetical protein HF086_007969 [Spodoptera exigua]
MDLSSGLKSLFLMIMEDWKIFLCLTILSSLYLYYTSTFNFFEKRGIPYRKPVIFVGNLGPRLRGKQSFHEFQLEVYNYFKGNRFGGIFEGRRPLLTILDPDLIKAITIRDFDHFTDRMAMNAKEPKFWSRSLLNLKGSEWKAVRSTLTPVFSSSRLRNMLPLIELCSKQMVQFLHQYDKKDVEMKQTIGHFTLEVAEKFDYMPMHKRIMLYFILIFLPQLIRYLNFSFLNLESSKELVTILKVAKDERQKSGVKKNDFLQILVDFSENERTESEKTKSTVLSRVDRVCTKPYNLPGTNVVIKPGEVVAIPLYGIQMDPEYYPEPKEFKPERFLNENKNERPSHLYMAFGVGPRNCIGLRFAMLSAKLAMVDLVKKFRFSACDKTEDPIQFDRRSLLLKARGGLWVRVEAI